LFVLAIHLLLNLSLLWAPTRFDIIPIYNYTLFPRLRRHAMEKKTSSQESRKLSQIFFPKQLNKVYPIRLHRSSSTSSISSLSSSFSQNSDDSSLTDSLNLADDNFQFALNLISPRDQRREPAVTITNAPHQQQTGEFRRCNWITKNCGMINFFCIADIQYKTNEKCHFSISSTV